MTSVYFLEAVGLDRIKIGIADRPEDRIRQFKTGCPAPMNLIGTIECPNRYEAQQLEKAFHKFFGNHRVIREWFSWDARTRHFVYYLLEWKTYNKIVDKFLTCCDEFYE